MVLLASTSKNESADAPHRHATPHRHTAPPPAPPRHALRHTSHRNLLTRLTRLDSKSTRLDSLDSTPIQHLFRPDFRVLSSSSYLYPHVIRPAHEATREREPLLECPRGSKRMGRGHRASYSPSLPFAIFIVCVIGNSIWFFDHHPSGITSTPRLICTDDEGW